jgi:hypothetical protein
VQKIHPCPINASKLAKLLQLTLAMSANIRLGVEKFIVEVLQKMTFKIFGSLSNDVKMVPRHSA